MRATCAFTGLLWLECTAEVNAQTFKAGQKSHICAPTIPGASLNQIKLYADGST